MDDKSDESVYVSIIASNRLAANYLADIVSRRSRNYLVYLEEPFDGSSGQGPIVFVLDSSYPSLPVGHWVRDLGSRFENPRFVVVDVARKDAEIVHLLCLGVHGFVDHSSVAGTLLSAIDAVASGHHWVSRRVLQLYVDLTAQHGSARKRRSQVPTAREAEVLELAKRRLSNREIAQILEIRESTVKYHISNILGKLGASTRHDLAGGAANAGRVRESRTGGKSCEFVPPA